MRGKKLENARKISEKRQRSEKNGVKYEKKTRSSIQQSPANFE